MQCEENPILEMHSLQTYAKPTPLNKLPTVVGDIFWQTRATARFYPPNLYSLFYLRLENGLSFLRSFQVIGNANVSTRRASCTTTRCLLREVKTTWCTSSQKEKTIQFGLAWRNTYQNVNVRDKKELKRVYEWVYKIIYFSWYMCNSWYTWIFGNPSNV